MDDHAIVEDASNLPALAVRINEEHRQAEAHARSAVEHAVEAGHLLITAKLEQSHGTWLAWLTANITFSPRRAQEYMQLARHWDELSSKSADSAHLTVDAALKALAEPSAPTPGTNREDWHDPGFSLVPDFVGTASADVKRAVVAHLVEDLDVQDHRFTRKAVKKAVRVGEARLKQRQKIHVARMRRGIPPGPHESFMAAADLVEAMVRCTAAMNRYSDAIDAAMRNDPNLDWVVHNRVAIEQLAAAYERAGDTIEHLGRFLESGRTDIDRFLGEVLRGEGPALD